MNASHAVMASRRQAEPKAPERTELLDTATRLESRLASGLIDQPLCAQLRTSISAAAPAARHKNPKLSAKYDESAVRIWNATLRLSRESSSSITRALPVLRAFALALLRVSYHSAKDSGSVKNETVIRLLRTSLKVVKTCIDATELDLATETLQNAADYVAFLANGAGASNANTEVPLRVTADDLITEYWMLRSMLSWRQDRLDMAEIHFQEAAEKKRNTSATTSTKVADLAYEIGKDLAKRTGDADCVAWFEHASKILDRVPSDEASPDTTELHLSISRDLARALIKEGMEHTCSRAADLISYLENQQGPKIGVLLLKIDLLTSRGPPDALAYQAIVHQMIQTSVLGNQSFKTILEHIRRLHALSSPLAQQSLTRFLTTRLFEYEDRSFIERAVLMFAWIASTNTSNEGVEALRKTLDDTFEMVKSPFEDNATHAAQTLCWKQVETAMKTQVLDCAEQWCRIALHPLFVNAGDSNKAKIARKLMLVSLHAGRTAAAREAFYQMPQSGREAPASQYLLYRTALLDDDSALASDCLSKLVGSPDANAELLYACAQEAQQHNSREYALKALQAILQKSGKADLKGVKVPTLVRCMIQMMLGEMETAEDISGHLMDVQRLFAQASTSVDFEANENGRDDMLLELQWFAKTSYNFASRYMARLEPRDLLAAIDACLSFTKRLLPSEKSSDNDQTRRRLSTCHYIGASVCVVLARSENEVSSSAQYYSEALKHITGFSEHNKELDQLLANVPSSDVISKRAQMLRLEIEALFKLKQFDRLDQVFAACIGVDHGEHLDILADLIIAVHSVMVEQQIDERCLHRIPTLMQKIVNESWRRNKSDMAKLARWLRCVFRMTSNTSPDTALRVLEQASAIARDNGLVRESHRYPPAELEWLASTAFNTAVDRSCASDQEGCHVWAEAALNLARASTDTARLFAQMQGLWLRLQEQQAAE